MIRFQRIIYFRCFLQNKKIWYYCGFMHRTFGFRYTTFSWVLNFSCKALFGTATMLNFISLFCGGLKLVDHLLTKSTKFNIPPMFMILLYLIDKMWRQYETQINVWKNLNTMTKLILSDDKTIFFPLICFGWKNSIFSIFRFIYLFFYQSNWDILLFIAEEAPIIG